MKTLVSDPSPLPEGRSDGTDDSYVPGGTVESPLSTRVGADPGGPRGRTSTVPVPVGTWSQNGPRFTGLGTSVGPRWAGRTLGDDPGAGPLRPRPSVKVEDEGNASPTGPCPDGQLKKDREEQRGGD